MTREEMIAKLKAKKEAVEVVKNAEDTAKDLTKGAIEGNTKADVAKDIPSVSNGTEDDVKKFVNAAVKSTICVDKNGVSKNGGDDDALMTADGIEGAKKKQDAHLKDVINVSTRQVTEAQIANADLNKQLAESEARERAIMKILVETKEKFKKEIYESNAKLTESHAKKMKDLVEKLIVQGEKIENALKESAERNKTMYKKAKKMHESSNRLNKILLEAVKQNRSEKKYIRHVTAEQQLLESLNK